jgi:hypothetical protein
MVCGLDWLTRKPHLQFVDRSTKNRQPELIPSALTARRQPQRLAFRLQEFANRFRGPFVVVRSANERPFAERKATLG